jgi:hypothetical protein
MGSGSWLLAQITGPAKDNGKGASGATRNFLKAPSQTVFLVQPANLPGSQDPARPTGRRRHVAGSVREADTNHESNQANRAISTSQLNASPRLHIWPINVVVFHGSDREHSFRGGFPA